MNTNKAIFLWPALVLAVSVCFAPAQIREAPAQTPSPGAAEPALPQVYPQAKTRLISGVSFIDGVSVRGMPVASTNKTGQLTTNFALVGFSELFGGYVVVAPTLANCRQQKVRKLLAEVEAPLREAQQKKAAALAAEAEKAALYSIPHRQPRKP